MNDTCNVTIKTKSDVITVSVKKGSRLYDVITEENTYFDHPCGGMGRCKKCGVLINGKAELSCRYIVNEDITVEINTDGGQIQTARVSSDKNAFSSDISFALDIGTTTLAAAIFNSKGDIIRYRTRNNSQRKFGSDVLSRIAFCADKGPGLLQSVLLEDIRALFGDLLKDTEICKAKKLYAAGNTTMLHTFLGIDCSSIGVSPYTPVFLDMKELEGSEINLDFAEKIVLLPGINSFVGADIVSGLVYIGIPDNKGVNMLVDLGTNAECVIYSSDRILCTSAAAGPCFEGANIACGMSAVKGAISSFRPDGSFDVIGDCTPSGVCATGLIDVMTYLIDRGIVDSTGKMNCGRYDISDDVYITQEDVRQYQLAKSAVYSAVSILISRFGIETNEIKTFYVAGGISSRLNIENAVKSGLFPSEISDKFVPVDNSCLSGLIRFAVSGMDLSLITDKSEYIDLGSDTAFSELFIKNMLFN